MNGFKYVQLLLSQEDSLEINKYQSVKFSKSPLIRHSLSRWCKWASQEHQNRIKSKNQITLAKNEIEYKIKGKTNKQTLKYVIF